VRFANRWQGRLTSFEIDEDWEVLNITIGSGFLAWKQSVKLPFSVASDWSHDFVALSCTSFQAFRRELPPVAAPARPVSVETPVSQAGAKLAGALVDRTSRRATEVLTTRRGRTVRAPVSEARFEGKMLRIGIPYEQLPVWEEDGTLLARVLEAVRNDQAIPPDTRRSVEVDVAAGVVTLCGNARVRQAADRLAATVRAVPGVLSVVNDIAPDHDIETAIGLELDRAGLQKGSEVYARSTLGEVILFGAAPSLRAVDDITRVVSKVPGVRKIDGRLELRPGAERPALPTVTA